MAALPTLFCKAIALAKRWLIDWQTNHSRPVNHSTSEFTMDTCTIQTNILKRSVKFQNETYRLVEAVVEVPIAWYKRDSFITRFYEFAVYSYLSA